MDRPTFSPFWHRVASSKPRLRPHVQITRQHYRRGRWHVAHDPASNQFFRLNPVAYDLVCALDGERTVDEAWKLCLDKYADAAPTQNEVIELLSQLYSSNLLSIDAAPEVEQLLRRGRERTAKKIRQQVIGLMYFRFKLFNPDPLLSWLEPIFRPALSKTGLVLWALLVIVAIASIIPDARRIAGGLDSLSNPANWGWMLLTFVLLKAWHELGHGLICKRLGGQVPETGFIMLVLLPSPYVDASAAWAFRSKWQRALVGAGGMIFELAAAAVAALIWVRAADGTLLKELCSYVMISASITTIFFNANPLMRFDGYFILSDLLEIPNLMQRSVTMLKFLFQRHVYRIESARPPTTLPGEAIILLVFGVLSLAYRIFLFVVITFVVLGMFFIVGIILALWSAAAWFLLPTGTFVHWLATSPALGDRRGRAVMVSLAMAALTTVLVGIVPLPDWRRVTGVIEPIDRAGVYAGAEGFVKAVHARPGQNVNAGDPILTLDSPELESNIALAEANIRSLESSRREAIASGDPDSAAVALAQLGVYRESLIELKRRRGELVVRAPMSGVIVTADPDRLSGAYLQIGAPICEVVNPTKTRVAATLNQTEVAWIFQTPKDQLDLRMRPASDLSRVITGTSVVALPAAQRRLPHAALGVLGGGEFLLKPEDPSGKTSKQEQFIVQINAESEQLKGLPPGQRVYILATLPSKPLLDQVVERFSKALQGRFWL
jgi:putative peptide zinc metalloprotease protein